MAGAQANPADINRAARAAIRAMAVPMTQQIFSESGLQGQSQITVKPQNVGLITGFWVQVVLTIHNGSAEQLDLTDFGPANALSNIQFLDLANVTRINTPGWHVHFVNSAKVGRPFGSALVRTTGFDLPINYGALADGQIDAPATIAAGESDTVTMWYWIPLAYSQDDLRGVIYANVVQATMQLLLSLPGSNGVRLAAANGTDSTLALYVGHAAGSVAAVDLSGAAITVWQCYYDQLPKINGQLLLPLTDLATAYELKQTTQSGVVPGQDFNYMYSNFRDFLSTTAVYVNTGATGARANGSDINYWQLLAANLTPIWRIPPSLHYLRMRNRMQTDMPPGVYYFDSRERPIATTQYGNMQLSVNPITAGSGAYEMVAVEDFALLTQLSTAGSLASS